MLYCSTPASQVEILHDGLAAAHALEYTTRQAELGPDRQPIPYFVVPDGTDTAGLAVVSYAELKGGAAALDERLRVPAVYGVAPWLIKEESALADNPIAQKLAGQYHVLAEYEAQRLGLMRKQGRAVGELAVAKIVGGAQRAEYLETRLLHLEALGQIAITHADRRTRDRITTELALAIEALKRISPESQ